MAASSLSQAKPNGNCSFYPAVYEHTVVPFVFSIGDADGRIDGRRSIYVIVQVRVFLFVCRIASVALHCIALHLATLPLWSNHGDIPV